MEATPVSANKIVLKDELKYNGVTLLTYQIEYPEFSSPLFRKCLSRINRLYRNRALKFQHTCETELFDMAIKQYKDDIANNFPVRVFEAMQVFGITDLRACIISLYFDRYEYTGGAHGNTVRTSQTWNLQTCGLFRLPQLVRCPPNYKAYVLSQVAEQIRQEPELYFDNYLILIAKTFNQNSFYCTPEGITVYYQQYDIAPYSSGIREFLLPYSRCVVNPMKFCIL